MNHSTSIDLVDAGLLAWRRRKGKKFEVVEKKQERTDSISAHCDKRHMRRLIGPIRVLLWRL